MGQQLGTVSIEKIRAFIKRQKRLKGYNYSATVGTSSFDLNLSGTARLLLGIAVLPADPLATSFEQISAMQFTVNNEIVIDTLNPNFLTNKLNNNEYYFIPRPLSGTDTLTLKFVNTGGEVEGINVVLYYI